MGLLSVIGGVAGSLLSGFGAKSAAKKANRKFDKIFDIAVQEARIARDIPVERYTTSSIDIKKMRDDAEAAGFNPLTVLRAGGLSGYIQGSERVSGENAGLPAQIAASFNPGYTQEPSTASVLGGALSTGVSLYDDYKAQMVEQNYRQQMLNAYVGGVSKASRSSGAASVFGIPHVTSRGVEVTSSRGGSMGSTRKATDSMLPTYRTKDDSIWPSTVNNLGQSKVTLDDDKIINPFPAAWGVEIPPWLKSAEAWENLLGDNEIFSTVAGIGNAVSIGGWNAIRLLDGAQNKLRRAGIANSAEAPLTWSQSMGSKNRQVFMRPRN